MSDGNKIWILGEDGILREAMVKPSAIRYTGEERSADPQAERDRMRPIWRRAEARVISAIEFGQPLPDEQESIEFLSAKGSIFQVRGEWRYRSRFRFNRAERNYPEIVEEYREAANAA